MKKVLLLTQHFPPETSAPANRIGSMADTLSQYYDLHVVVLKPSYPSPALYDVALLDHHDSQRRYTITRTFAFHPHKGKLLLRALREHLMALRLAVHAVSVPADIVVTSCPSMFLGPVGLGLARAKRARFVWDIRDITWRYAKEFAGGSLLVRFGVRLIEKYMHFVLHNSDLVVAVTSGAAKALIEQGVAPEKIITVPNGVSKAVLEAVQKAAGDAPGAPGLPRPKVAYAGNMAYTHGIGVLVDVAAAMPEVDFVLAGGGAELPLIKEKARKLKTANVSFRGWLSREDVLKVYAQSDVLFTQIRSNPTLDETVLTSKIFEYMATGRPLVYAGRGLGAEFLDKVGCAVIASPDDPESIAAAIRDLLRHPSRMQALGSRGRDFMQQNYHREDLMKDFVRQLQERFEE